MTFHPIAIITQNTTKPNRAKYLGYADAHFYGNKISLEKYSLAQLYSRLQYILQNKITVYDLNSILKGLDDLVYKYYVGSDIYDSRNYYQYNNKLFTEVRDYL